MNVIISYNGPRRDDVDLFLQNTIPGKLVGSGYLLLGGGSLFESVVDRDAQ